MAISLSFSLPKSTQGSRGKLERKKPLEEIVHFEIALELANLTTKTINASVYVKSSTQAVVFVWDEPKEVWKRHLGIIPYKKEVEVALDNAEAYSINGNGKQNYVFHGWYRPHFAFKDFNFRGKIVITYRIYARSEGGSPLGIYFDTGFRKIAVPFKDVVEYKKIGA